MCTSRYNTLEPLTGMRRAGQTRFFFALAALLLWLAPASAQSPAPQNSPAGTSKTRADPRRAKKAYQKGLRAEQAEDWRAAFDAYAEAATYSPGDTDLILRREAARFRIVQQHTDRAEREALAGRMEHAREELRAALQLDPGFSVARERLAQFSPPEPPQAKLTPSPLPGGSEAEAPVQLQPQAGTRDFNHRGDVRTAYEDIARQFGVVASFDPDLPGRPVHFRIRGVDFATAMTVLGQETRTFWKALDAHTFFVAENTPAKRHEYAPVIVRTILLSAATTPEGMTETVRLLREIVGITHAELDTRTRTLTLRDSPENVALAVALLQEIERARGELMLEIEILEVDRNMARQLGITPPSTAQVITFSPTDVRALRQARTTSELLAIIQRIFGTTLPPLIAFGGGQTTFLATLPGAASTFSKTLNLVRSGRRVLLRAEEGQPATFFVGERFPIALGVLGPSFLPPAAGAPSSQLVFPRADFPTGTSPVAVVAASFRTGNSQQLDLAVANKTSNNVSILLGKPDGSFGTKTDFSTGATPVALVAGDFNADGKLDLAIVNQVDKTVSILLGQGDGTFKPVSGTLPQTGNGPSAIVAGDFNADGKLDLAVVNQTDSTVSIFLGNGDGTFKARTDIPTGSSPTALAASDFNGDGKLDLAVVNKNADTVSVLLGKGDGTFNAKTDFPTGKGPVAITTADFNRDGRADLAVANQAANTVSILLGKGDGTFNAKNDFSTGTSPVALVAADFNLDGRLDLVVANQGSNTISILLGNGDGTIGLRADVNTGNSPSALATADFNQDNRPDVAITNQADNTVSVILNTTSFTAPSGIPQTAFPGAEYEEIGLKVRATPRMHANNEVTLQLEFEIRSLSGTAVNGIPVISNRTVQQTVRLRENEPAVLSGIIEQTETRTISGSPGFARLPGVGYLGGVRNKEIQETELLIVITPRALRLPSQTRRSIYAGRGEPSPGGARPPQ